MGHHDYKMDRQGYKLAGPSDCLATTVILLVGQRQFEVLMLILALTLSKNVEMDLFCVLGSMLSTFTDVNL